MTETETILCKILDCDRAALYLELGRRALSAAQSERLHDILKKRAAGEPLQYLLGEADFMGLALKVSPGVLVPRPETEILVERALDWVAEQKRDLKVLDIGSGSGNIAIALAKSASGLRLSIASVDISDICLETARANAARHGVGDRVTFFGSDIFSSFKENEAFDVIISNPPYVTQDEYQDLPQDVKREPRAALVGGEDGLYFYRRIQEGARRHLKGLGIIFLEIGETQAEAVKDIFCDRSFWADARIIKDYNDKDRVAIIERSRGLLA